MNRLLMLNRLKQKFISRKKQRHNQVKAHHNSELQQQQQQSQQQSHLDQTHQEPQQKQLLPWSKFNKDSSVDLHCKDLIDHHTSPAQALDLPSPPTNSVPEVSQPYLSPPPQQQEELNQKATESDEESQRQIQAVQWIQSNMRRKSTLPHYPSLERYEIIKKLGDGAFSDVYRARDKRTGRNVAIKVAQKYTGEDPMINLQHLHPSIKKKPRVTERANILKEVQIMRNIHHPNIVQLIHFTESRQNYFLVLDLCEGGELFHRIVDLTYFSEDLSRHIIGQLAQAVYHLHEECGVVHRDIKPENILFEPVPIIPSQQRKLHVFDDDSKKDEGVFIKDVGGGGIGQVKLADFGLSKVIWDSTALTPCGTLGYTAPEILSDQKYSKGVDMWAIGCVLYTMLCGFPPFYDESISALTQKVARGQFAFLSPWWDPISDEAKNLIQGLLCVEPSKRYTVRQVLQHPWLTGVSMNPSLSTTGSLLDDTESMRIQAIRNAANAASSTPDKPQQSTPSSRNADDKQLPTNMIVDTRSSSTTTISDLDSTGSSSRRKDVFSPGMATLKEIFDITAAVQRMAEENMQHGVTATRTNDNTYDQHRYEMEHSHQKQHRHYHHDQQQQQQQQRQYRPIRPTTKQQYNAQAAAHHQQKLATITGSTVTPASMATGTASIGYGPRRRQPGFDLNMGNATLLKNRRTKRLVTPCQ